MNEVSRKFNDLLDAEVNRIASEPHSDEYYAQDHVMHSIASRNPRTPFLLDGKPVKYLWHEGGPDSNQYYWNVAVEWDGKTFLCNGSYDSYEYSELAVFHEAESYVEPVTKYRVK